MLSRGHSYYVTFNAQYINSKVNEINNCISLENKPGLYYDDGILETSVLLKAIIAIDFLFEDSHINVFYSIVVVHLHATEGRRDVILILILAVQTPIPHMKRDGIQRPHPDCTFIYHTKRVASLMGGSGMPQQVTPNYFLFNFVEDCVTLRRTTNFTWRSYSLCKNCGNSSN